MKGSMDLGVVLDCSSMYNMYTHLFCTDTKLETGALRYAQMTMKTIKSNTPYYVVKVTVNPFRSASKYFE